MLIDIDKLEKIHHTVFTNFKYATDQKQYKLIEKWVMPGGEYNGSQRVVGDCEDFALACRKLCREAGIPTRLVACYTELDEGHCVLESDGWILDNRKRHVISRDRLEQDGYRWIAISGYESGDQWYRIES